MQTKRPTLLNCHQVEIATRIVRAYKHPFRYDIIGRLLQNGKMSSGEIASYMNLEENYIEEQLETLSDTGLVLSEESDNGIYFMANEDKLLKVKNSIQSVFRV
jgi:DNA-binding transcriptional ArsR family regulator